MIPDDVISQIRDAANIREVVGMHVQLKKAGRAWKGLCPFHGEKTPSFNVMPDKQFFHCFGCQKNGDVFTFVMEIEGKSFVEVAENLAQRYSIELPRVEESPELRRARGERHAMLDANKLATAFFRAQLADPARGEAARAYLASRGIGDDIASRFQLGFAPAEWQALTDHLRDKHVDPEIALKLGLVKRSSSGRAYDAFRDRLVCPIIAPGGEVHGFSARLIAKPAPAPDGGEPPKYVNSPESTVYKKGKMLFGLAQALDGMRATKRVVVVEGNFDVISLHQAGFAEVVAPLGTALTAEQIGVLRRMSDRIVLLYDGDKAGYKATLGALQLCIEQDVEVLVARRPGSKTSGGAGPLADGVDPDSLVAGGGAAQLREAVERAQGGIEFFCYEVWSKAPANSDARARALEAAAAIAAKVATPVKRDLITDTLAKGLGVELGVVRNAIARAAGHPSAGRHDVRSQRPEPPPTSLPDPPAQEVELFALFTDHPSLMTTAEADRAFSLLTDTRLRAMYSAAQAGQSVLELAPVLLQQTTAKTVLSGKYVKTANPAVELKRMVAGLEMRSLSVQVTQVRKELAELQRAGNQDPARQQQLQERADKLAHDIVSKRKQVD
jgi:DNA primase